MSQTGLMYHFVSHDNQQITYHYFPSRSQNGPLPAIILFYRRGDFYYEAAEFVAKLGMADYAFFAVDFADSDIVVETADGSSAISHEGYYFQQFIDHITAQYSIRAKDIALISHGNRAVVIAAWMTDYAPDIRSVIFYSPQFFFRKRDALLYKLKGIVKRQPLTYPSLSDLLYSSLRVFRSAFAWPTPTQFVLTKDDREKRPGALISFYANLGCRIKALLMMPDAGFGCPEQEWDAVTMTQTRSFLTTHFSQMNPAPSLFDSYLRGATQEEYEKLRLPERNAFKHLYWVLAAFALRRVGQLSTGVRLGLETGFDSGASLDYVYENQPSGQNALGTILDRYYLNNIGWHCT